MINAYSWRDKLFGGKTSLNKKKIISGIDSNFFQIQNKFLAIEIKYKTKTCYLKK